jgi:hypothetical protein
MKLNRFPLDQRAIVEFVLAGDPSVAAANAGNVTLMQYRHVNSDMSDLVVPEDATLVRFRPLQKHERDNAATLAGRVSQTGARLYQEGLQKAAAAHEAALKRATLAGGDPTEVLTTFDRTLAAFVDGLTDGDARAVHLFRAWEARRCAEIVRRAVVAVVLSTDEAGNEDVIASGPDGFPVAEFEAAVSVFLAQQRLDVNRHRAEALAQAGEAQRQALAALTDEERQAVVAAVDAGRLADVPADIREAMEARDRAERMGWHGAFDGAALIEEMAAHVERVSSLGKGGRTSSSTPSGGGMGTT